MSPFVRELKGLVQCLRDAARIFVLAPFALLLGIVPQFVQHGVEIRLGMFASKAAFSAYAMDPARLMAGQFKLAGLTLAVVCIARFWANRARGARGWSFSGIAWQPLALGLLVQVVCSLPAMLGLSFGPAGDFAVGGVLTLLSLPGLVLMVAGLLGDRGFGLGEAYRRGWTKALRLALYLVPVWLVLQTLHEANHALASGRPMALVWALMGWDALVVGAMAAFAGTGLHHAYVGPRINAQEGIAA